MSATVEAEVLATIATTKKKKKKLQVKSHEDEAEDDDDDHIFLCLQQDVGIHLLTHC